MLSITTSTWHNLIMVIEVRVSPPLSEVYNYDSHWYQLGIQDVIELEEIKNEARSDKRSMYQLWLRSKPGATRRQFLSALRAKHVGDNTIEEICEQELIQMVSLRKH